MTAVEWLLDELSIEGYSEMISADGELIEPAVVKKAGGETIQVTIPK